MVFFKTFVKKNYDWLPVQLLFGRRMKGERWCLSKKTLSFSPFPVKNCWHNISANKCMVKWNIKVRFSVAEPPPPMPPKKPSKKVGVQQLACPTRYPCNLNIHIFLMSEYFSFMNKLLSTRNVQQSATDRWGKVRGYEDKWGYMRTGGDIRGHILIPIKRVSYCRKEQGGKTGQAWQPSLASPLL